jgi:hypothetical protein
MSGPVEVVLSLIGLSDVSGQVKTPLSLLFLVATAAISVLLGALRGVSVRVSQREGLAFRYTGGHGPGQPAAQHD